MKKTPYEKWNFVRRFNVIMIDMIGAAVVEHDFKVTLKTLIPIYIEANFVCLLLYTLIHYRNEPFKGLVATPPIGVLIPVRLFEIVLRIEKYQSPFE